MQTALRVITKAEQIRTRRAAGDVENAGTTSTKSRTKAKAPEPEDAEAADTEADQTKSAA